MQAWQASIKRWHQLSITTKFTAAYSFLLLVFFVVSLTGYFSLISAQRKTDQAIINSTQIQNLVLAMDRDMKNARVLQRDFFMRYPFLGYEVAQETYAVPAQDEIAKALALSEELQKLTSQADASEKLRDNYVNLNMYLNSAGYYETTFIEAIDLVTQLVDPETGKQVELVNQADLIEEMLLDLSDSQLLSLYWEMRALEQTYLLTRKRPYMQSAFNVLKTLEDNIIFSDSLTPKQKKDLIARLDNYGNVAEAVLELDVELNGKLMGFDLQAETIDPISEELIALAADEVEYAQIQIEQTSQLATTVLIITAVSSLLAASFIAKLLNTTVTKNILLLKTFTEDYQIGKRDTPLSIPNEDELGQLANSFQMMANHTNKLIHDLEMNVVELQKTEKALRVSEQRFQSILQQAAVGIGILSLEGNWLQVNPMICDITGYREDELLARPFTAIIHAEEVKEADANMQRLLNTQQKRDYVTTRLIHKNENIVWVNQFITLVQSPDHIDDYIILILDDITERKQLESQLRQSQKMEAIGQLAGGIAHDFNNLLTIIISYSDLLLLTNKDAPERTIMRIQEIRDAGLRAAALTNQLLAFSRRQVLTMENLDLNDIILNMMNMLGRLIGENIELVTHLTETAYTIKADTTQLEQVILNMAINARDAMPQGGRLTIATQNVHVASRFDMQKVDLDSGYYLVLAISDNGLGMDEDVRVKIFEPFFTTKEIGKGTGLGLATVHGIINQFGGQIWVYSEVDQGTTFKIYFPAGIETVQNTPSSLPQVSYQGNETILLVEDEDAVRELVFHLLSENGYHVLVADSYTAEQVSREYPQEIDVLLTDVVMPEINGRDLAEQLLLMRPHMKVVFMSGYMDDVMVEYGILHEEMPFLQKPFTAVQLTQLIRKILDGDDVVPPIVTSNVEDSSLK